MSFDPFDKKRKKSNFLSQKGPETSEEDDSLEENLPEEIAVKYSLDYDIVRLDCILRNKLSQTSNKKDQQKILQKIESLELQLDNAVTVGRIKELERSIENLNKQLQEIKENLLLKNYLFETKSLIEEYKTLPKSATVVDITKLGNIKLTPTEKKKEGIVDRYLEISSKYTKLSIEKVRHENKKLNEQICVSCFESIKTSVIDSSGHKICDKCGSINKVSHNHMSNKDYDVLNNLIKSVNRDACMQYMGSLDVKEIMKQMDKYFEEQGLPSRNYWKTVEINQYGRKEGSEQQDIIDALDALGYKSQYKNYYFFCQQYFGWERSSITKHIEEVCTIFKTTRYVWDNEMTDDEKSRSSSLPTEYLKFKIYELIGYPCKASQFDLPTKIETIKRYDRTWKIMCERSKKPNIYFIPTYM